MNFSSDAFVSWISFFSVGHGGRLDYWAMISCWIALSKYKCIKWNIFAGPNDWAKMCKHRNLFPLIKYRVVERVRDWNRKMLKHNNGNQMNLVGKRAKSSHGQIGRIFSNRWRLERKERLVNLVYLFIYICFFFLLLFFEAN